MAAIDLEAATEFLSEEYPDDVGADGFVVYEGKNGNRIEEAIEW